MFPLTLLAPIGEKTKAMAEGVISPRLVGSSSAAAEEIQPDAVLASASAATAEQSHPPAHVEQSKEQLEEPL